MASLPKKIPCLENESFFFLKAQILFGTWAKADSAKDKGGSQFSLEIISISDHMSVTSKSLMVTLLKSFIQAAIIDI